MSSRYGFVLLATLAACGTSTRTESPSTTTAHPVHCSSGEPTTCCGNAHADLSSCEATSRVAGTKEGSNPCALDCGPGETAVELCPNCDERRWGCVACGPTTTACTSTAECAVLTEGCTQRAVRGAASTSGSCDQQDFEPAHAHAVCADSQGEDIAASGATSGVCTLVRGL
jgi:hypothetical protein